MSVMDAIAMFSGGSVVTPGLPRCDSGVTAPALVAVGCHTRLTCLTEKSNGKVENAKSPFVAKVNLSDRPEEWLTLIGCADLEEARAVAVNKFGRDRVLAVVPPSMAEAPPGKREESTASYSGKLTFQNEAAPRKREEPPAVAAESSQPASLPAFVFDDRRPCTECRNLSPMGRCLAASSPAMQRENVHRNYRPNPGILRRCDGFKEASQ